MIQIKEVLISQKSLQYIKKRWLEKQYIKAENFILLWKYELVNLKIREPKSNKVYYFRMNKQFRCLWRMEWGILKIYHVDNHQK